jgi:ubiquinone/menaquinone biosynthesis C-methylase UbiE
MYISLYTSKAENYAKYRWDYAREAISAIIQRAGVSNDTVVADIGAGTGILTRHFVGKAKMVYAIEPDPEMRAMASKLLETEASCMIMNASAEYTGLPDNILDVVLVGQAIHWFEPELARNEIHRILKPSGWLALLRNYNTEDSYCQSVNPLFEKFSKPGPARLISRQSEGFYYGNNDFQKMLFPFTFTQSWQGFIGSLISSAFMPDVEDEMFIPFEKNAMDIFTSLSVNDKLIIKGETELLLGRVPQ